jgi:hypothetical protein
LDIVDDVDYNDLGWDVVNTCNATIVEQRVTGYLSCCEGNVVIEQFSLEDTQCFKFTMLDSRENDPETDQYYALYRLKMDGTLW